MTSFDLIVRGGRVVTEDGETACDIGIRDGLIAALAPGLVGAARDIDVSGKLVVPGGIEAHCHIEQLSSAGLMGADDFYSGSVAAAFGGNTTIIPFAAQHRGQRLPEVMAECHRRAAEKSILDTPSSPIRATNWSPRICRSCSKAVCGHSRSSWPTTSWPSMTSSSWNCSACAAATAP
jgi:hypothetical protein